MVICPSGVTCAWRARPRTVASTSFGSVHPARGQPTDRREGERHPRLVLMCSFEPSGRPPCTDPCVFRFISQPFVRASFLLSSVLCPYCAVGHNFSNGNACQQWYAKWVQKTRNAVSLVITVCGNSVTRVRKTMFRNSVTRRETSAWNAVSSSWHCGVCLVYADVVQTMYTV